MTYLRREILVAYADNQLSTETRRAVEHMLASIPRLGTRWPFSR